MAASAFLYHRNCFSQRLTDLLSNVYHTYIHHEMRALPRSARYSRRGDRGADLREGASQGKLPSSLPHSRLQNTNDNRCAQPTSVSAAPVRSLHSPRATNTPNEQHVSNRHPRIHLRPGSNPQKTAPHNRSQIPRDPGPRVWGHNRRSRRGSQACATGAESRREADDLRSELLFVSDGV